MGVQVKDMDVSVITPTYNRAHLLPRAWNSIKNQKADFEWIVVDDGSTDNTNDVILLLDDIRITYLPLSQNCGVNVARNRGVDLAHGRYVVFLDSDDELFSGGLEYLVSVMDKANSDIGAAAFACVVSETGEQISVLPDGQVCDEYDVVCNDLLRDSGEKLYVYRKEVFENYKLPEDLRGCEHVFVYGISRKWKFLMINRPLRVIHRQEDNLSNADSLIARSFDIAQSYERIIEYHSAILKKNKSALNRLLKKAIYRYGVAGHINDSWRVYKILLKQAESIRHVMSGTILFSFSIISPVFEKCRIDRINSTMIGLK